MLCVCVTNMSSSSFVFCFSTWAMSIKGINMVGPHHICIVYVATAGLQGQLMGSDEQEIVLLIYIIIDVKQNKVGRESYCANDKSLVQKGYTANSAQTFTRFQVRNGNANWNINATSGFLFQNQNSVKNCGNVLGKAM